MKYLPNQVVIWLQRSFIRFKILIKIPTINFEDSTYVTGAQNDTPFEKQITFSNPDSLIM